MTSSTALVALEQMDVAAARLPVVYERAVSALAECSRIDECKDWANKAESLASYAKQAKDDQLRKMADRIQARAVRRCGELLKQIPSATGAHMKQGGTVPLSRTEAATEAGLSERQRKTALRTANVPPESFERQVESENPPTVTQLAEQGKKAAPRPSAAVDLGGIPPADYARATQALGTLERFAAFCSEHDPARIAAAVQRHEASEARAHVVAVDRWLDVFVTSLPEGATQ